MRAILLICVVVGSALAPSGRAAAGPTDCGAPGVDQYGAAVCRDAENEARAQGGSQRGPAPASCRLPVEGVFWTGTDWVRLASALANDPAPCGEYWVSIPPLAADKKGFRVLQDDVVRGLGVHPVAEVVLGEATGWANWVNAGNGTWFQAGVEFRRRMAAAGYGSAPAETWLINEFDRTTATDGPRAAADHPVPPYGRRAMRDLMAGLYYGGIGMPTMPGIAEIGIHFRHQNLPDVEGLKADLKGWLRDSPFWEDADHYLRWLAVEAYPDVRNWGVSGSSPAERRRHLEDYLFHVLELVRSGPTDVDVARAFMERAYLPLANGGYRARGGDQFAFVTGHGNTIVDAETMQHFVSEQVHAIRHFGGSHPQGAPAARLGFSWQPCNRLAATEAGCGTFSAAFQAELDAITARMAEAIYFAYRQGGASPVGACSPPGSHVDWCRGEVPGASFTEQWDAFRTWD
jgi:hypothetical protein